MRDTVREMDQFGPTDPAGEGSPPRRIVLLGSTGSIGTQAIDVIRSAPGRFEVVALAAGGSDIDAIVAQAIELHPLVIGVARAGSADVLRERLLAKWPAGATLPEVVDGPGAAAQLATVDADLVVNGIAGDQGLAATLAALGTGVRVALANKESLIAGGPLVLAAAAPGQLIPVDSEHSALAQALRAGRIEDVARLLITASGGPFRGRRRADLAHVTVADAMAHPTWSMGPLITINSATLVNKGLEVIEARLLYDIGFDRIEVVVHPQSIVHSMVEYVDGATIAAASPPDMRLPIALALAWPGRVPAAAPTFDWATASSWTFEPLDHGLFPAVELAYRAGEAGGCAPAVFNAANEELVAAFLQDRCGYLAITDGIESVLAGWLSDQHAAAGNPGTVEDIVQAQEWARAHAREYVSATG